MMKAAVNFIQHMSLSTASLIKKKVDPSSTTPRNLLYRIKMDFLNPPSNSSYILLQPSNSLESEAVGSVIESWSTNL